MVGIISIILNELFVDDATAWRVEEALAFLDKEALSDALVDNDDSDGGRRCNLVIELLDDLLELRNLSAQDLLAHGVTDTITIDNEVGWLAALSRLKRMNCFSN